jgi:hypothetical protein
MGLVAFYYSGFTYHTLLAFTSTMDVWPRRLVPPATINTHSYLPQTTLRLVLKLNQTSTRQDTYPTWRGPRALLRWASAKP